jgi:hypothetical protein
MAANQAAAGRLRDDLERLGYGIRELEGERIVSDESLFDALRRAFELPAEAPIDWGNVVERIVGARDDLGEREAVLWNRADASGFFSLRTVVEGTAALMAARARLDPGIRLEVILLGQTRDFPQPEEP